MLNLFNIYNNKKTCEIFTRVISSQTPKWAEFSICDWNRKDSQLRKQPEAQIDVQLAAFSVCITYQQVIHHNGEDQIS